MTLLRMFLCLSLIGLGNGYMQVSKHRSLSPLSAVKENGYNDDAFGGVFLTGLLVARDPLFCASFASLSFIAATVRNRRDQAKGDQNNQDKETPANRVGRAEQWLLPPVVAVNALVTSSLLSLAIDTTPLYTFLSLPMPGPGESPQSAWQSPPLLGAVLLSGMYGAIKYSLEKESRKSN